MTWCSMTISRPAHMLRAVGGRYSTSRQTAMYSTLVQRHRCTTSIPAGMDLIRRQGQRSPSGTTNTARLDMNFVFRPIKRGGRQLTTEQMVQEIRQRIGFVFAASTSYTDIHGYEFREIADQVSLLQRTYDEMEKPMLRLVIGALFDTDGDQIISGENIQNGYTRFRQLHQELADNAKGMNRRIILPNEKLAKLRDEYQAKQGRPFDFK